MNYILILNSLINIKSGWFGRGRAGSKAAQIYAQRNLQYLQRPAIKQKEFIDPKKYHLEGANEYNIWYGRFIGDEWDQKLGILYNYILIMFCDVNYC